MGAVDGLKTHPVVIDLGWTLLHFVWQGAGVAFVLAIMLFVLRRGRPATRYRAACIALALLAALPVATFWSLSGPAAANPATRGATLPAGSPRAISAIRINAPAYRRRSWPEATTMSSHQFSRSTLTRRLTYHAAG